MKTIENNLQIGVIGSAADLNYGKEIEEKAVELGIEIARRGFVLIFGAEKDCDSLSTAAARAARSAGGLTVGITYEKGKDIYDPSSADIIIPTGLIRGGGREMVQSLACDGVVAISGGSGTLNETTVAYQANIPVVTITGVGGWSDRLAGTYLDKRQRYVFEPVQTAPQALDKLVEMIELRRAN